MAIMVNKIKIQMAPNGNLKLVLNMLLIFRSRSMVVASQLTRTVKLKIKTSITVLIYTTSTTSTVHHLPFLKSLKRKRNLLVGLPLLGFTWGWCFPHFVGMCKTFGLILWTIAILELQKPGISFLRVTKKSLTNMFRLRQGELTFLIELLLWSIL